MADLLFSLLPYISIFGVGAAAGLSRTVRDHSERSVIKLLATGACAGFLSFAVVYVFMPDAWQSGAPAHGVSMLVGLAGPEVADVATQLLTSRLLSQWGITQGKDDEQADDVDENA